MCEVFYIFPPILPVWMRGAVINKNRSCSVSSGLSQLAFWVLNGSSVEHALHVCAPKSTSGEEVRRETLGNRKYDLSRSSPLLGAVKLPPSAECPFKCQKIREGSAWEPWRCLCLYCKIGQVCFIHLFTGRFCLWLSTYIQIGFQTLLTWVENEWKYVFRCHLFGLFCFFHVPF